MKKINVVEVNTISNILSLLPFSFCVFIFSISEVRVNDKRDVDLSKKLNHKNISEINNNFIDVKNTTIIY